MRAPVARDAYPEEARPDETEAEEQLPISKRDIEATLGQILQF